MRTSCQDGVDPDQKSQRALELWIASISALVVSRQIETKPMANETYSSIVWGTIFFGLLLFVIVYERRRRRTKRRLIMQLLKRYFDAEISADQLDQRTRKIANHCFTKSPEFHSLTVASFQCAVDAKLLKSAYSNQEEKKLLSLLAALKKKYGLTDLYRLETWRSGRQ